MSFRESLSQLVQRSHGARGAVFCDYEGEFVELVIADERLTDYDMKIVGAQVAAAWLSLHNGANERGAGGIVELKLQCSAGSLLCRNLRDGYYLVLLLAEGTPTAAASFELQRTAAEVSTEL